MYAVGREKRVFHKIHNGGNFFQTDISSPNGNFVERTCPHICAKIRSHLELRGVLYVGKTCRWR